MSMYLCYCYRCDPKEYIIYTCVFNNNHITDTKISPFFVPFLAKNQLRCDFGASTVPKRRCHVVDYSVTFLDSQTS